ncbi:hypothetical protein QTP88_004550 [Uroleucon formosanum]
MKIKIVLILNIFLYFQLTTQEDLATKISSFASALKEKFDELVVGIIFNGMSHTSFTDNTLFDFSITNKVLDIYIIDWSLLNDCNNDTVQTGMSPITSTDNTIVTIEQVTCSVTNSSMDKSKIYAMIYMYPIIPVSLLPKLATHDITTYSIKKFVIESSKCLPTRLSCFYYAKKLCQVFNQSTY